MAQRRENFGEVEGIEIVEAVAAAEAQRILVQPRRCAAQQEGGYCAWAWLADGEKGGGWEGLPDSAVFESVLFLVEGQSWLLC